MGATIKDVARQAGVSVATVSYVLTENKPVSSELTERVRKAIEVLGYRPSHVARSLKTRRSNSIGLMVPDITNPFFAEIAVGVEQAALRNGYQMLLANTDGDYRREVLTIESFCGHEVDGIINVAPRMPETGLLQYINGTPMVVIDRPLSITHERLGMVYADNVTGGSDVARHLLSRGHSRFACIAGPTEVPNVQSRLQGFLSEIEGAGIPASDVVTVFGDFKFDSGFRLMETILDLTRLPTAVFVCNDLMAWGALEQAKKQGLRVPQDISIAGFDNISFSELVSPRLTTVDQPRHEAGEAGMQMMLYLLGLNGATHTGRTVVLRTQLVVRETT